MPRAAAPNHLVWSPYVNTLPVVGIPELDTVLHSQSYKCQMERKDHFPDLLPALLLMQLRDVGHFRCCKGTPLAHARIAVPQDSQIPFYSTASQTVCSQPTPLQRVIPSHRQDLAFAFAELL